jgi:hypothetical protein
MQIRIPTPLWYAPWYVKPKPTDIIMKTQDILKLAVCLNWQNHCTYPYSKFSFGDTPMHNNQYEKFVCFLGMYIFKFSKGFQN